MRRGGDFAALAKEHSEDEATRPKGGLWGQVALKDLPPKMAEAVRGLKQNEVGEPFRSRYGYHLFKWTKKIPAGHVPLSEVKTDIMNLLLREKTLTEHRKMVGQLRKKARIQLFY
ncbi:MAG: hypothetical protein GWM98_05945 [Nitrospinaceae bacterium]|nr:hypothetical protein [Nitrospinaceae bacterium]NIR54099.1 hypothetical protein [Nitrospinaceae bacterium]NIS84517.1 hypothetical protein [Nitrospinaceae bacterium]NIT81312.1 hypothetical protein [Nitrospinaceae bacterium]NIU43599.1 hypothetical protein [Nitrospinaceae bacterium]